MKNKKGKSKAYSVRKPVVLYDHLPGILAGYPAALFTILGCVSLLVPVSPHMLFWVGLSIMAVWLSLIHI